MEKGFTLVIPLYNKIDTVRRTLDSVLNNHGSYPFKCIIVDDDSTDGSSEIALEYDRNYPDMFQYIKRTHHEKKTPAYARNLGIKLTETEYIGFLDADDEICPGFIDRGCTFLDEHPEYSLYGNGCKHQYITDNGQANVINVGYANFEIINDWNQFTKALAGNVSFCANIYRTELVKKNLFTDCFCEDTVFKFKYVFKNSPIYIDNSTYETFIYHTETSASGEWNHQRIDVEWELEIIKTVHEDLGFKITFYKDENGNQRYQVHK